MKTSTKIWLITAAALVLLGCIIFGVVMMMLNWNFSLLSTHSYETNRHVLTEAFDSIAIITDTADISLVRGDTAETVVECREQTNLKHEVSVKDGVLTIEIKDTRRWYEHIGIGIGDLRITITLPAEAYASLSVKSSTGHIDVPAGIAFTDVDISESTGDVRFAASVENNLRIKASTGDIRVEDVSVGALELSVSTGDITVSDVTCAGDATLRVSTGKTVLSELTCQSLQSTGNTGDITLQSVVATNKITIERSTGQVKLEASDAAELSIRTDTGDVKGTLLSDKIFIVRTDTGDIDVPSTVTGGKCEITTDTGDIRIRIQAE